MRRAALACLAFLVELALAGCSGKDSATTAGDASSPAPAKPPAADTNAPLYPDWARAIVSPYPNTVMGILVNQNLYQFQSGDDRATVAAWYRARVKDSWEADATTGNLHVLVNGVQIAVANNPSGTPGTAIFITRR